MKIFSITNNSDIEVSTIEEAANIRLEEIRQKSSENALERFGIIELILMTAVSSGIYEKEHIKDKLSDQQIEFSSNLKFLSDDEAVNALRTAISYEIKKQSINSILDDEISDEEKILLIEEVM